MNDNWFRRDLDESRARWKTRAVEVLVLLAWVAVIVAAVHWWAR